MFGNKRFRVTRPVIKKEDLKKAIVKANDRIKVDTARMKESLQEVQSKSQSVQDEIKKAGKELKNITSKINSRISECTAIESQLLYLKDDFSSLTDKFKKELNIEESLRSSVDALVKKESELGKSVVLLEKKKEETSSINISLKGAKQEYNRIKEDLLSIRSDKGKENKTIRDLIIIKESMQNEYDKSAEKLGLLNAQAKNEIQDMENMLAEKKEYFQVETTRLDKMITDRIEELSDNTELSNRKAREYEGILSKVMLAEKKIAQAEIQAKQVIENKEIQIEKIKEKFKTWKLTQLDQVAKLKLKGKIDNIDKVGLLEALDVKDILDV